MVALTKNAISVTVKDRAKQTKIWDHKGYKSLITNKSLITETVRHRAKRMKFGIIRAIICKSTIL